MLVREQKYLASLKGSRITQQRVRVKGDLTAVRIDKSTGAFETMGNAAPPAGRGWEFFTTGYDWMKDADEIPALLEQKMSSPSIKPGRYDIVIDPTNLWLTIHESIGHSTELDRVLGYEANYAGTSFATLDKLNTLQFGAPMMHVTGDRQVEHGLSTVGYDDEGVAAQTWDIVRDGVLVGYQLDRQMAHKQGFGRSNGCAFADQAGHVPLQRMPNVSLSASAKDITLTDLIAGIDEGLYIVGDKSWSIDMQRYNFQFTGQKFFHDPWRQDCRAGQRCRVSVAHDRFLELRWKRSAVPRPMCWAAPSIAAKANPVRLRPVTHGCPAALFRQINILNTARGGALITLQDTIDRVLQLSKADACIVIATTRATVNIRWAHNTVTTNGDADEVQLSVISIIGRRVASVTRTHFPPERLEEIVREAEAACARRPEAPDYMPLVEGDWRSGPTGRDPPADADIHVFDPLVPQLATMFEQARRAGIATFGYAEFRTETTLLATSTGIEEASHRAHRQGRNHGEDARLRAVVVGRAGDARFSRHRSRARCSRRLRAASRMGGRSASTCLPAPTRCCSSRRAPPTLPSPHIGSWRGATPTRGEVRFRSRVAAPASASGCSAT